MRCWKIESERRHFLDALRKVEVGGCLIALSGGTNRIDGNTNKCLCLCGKAGIGKSTCVEVLVFEFDILHLKYLCNLARH